MEFGAAKKRGRPEGGMNGNVGYKKYKPETESLTTGIGTKSKPCTKFFSPSGCPFGEGCHFLHYVPGGIKAVTQMLGNNPAIPSPRNPVAPPSFRDGSSPLAVKTRLCNRFSSAEGCKFGDKCNFAHGEWELGKPTVPNYDDPRSMGHIPGRYGGGGGGSGYMEPPLNLGPAASFGVSATAKISIDGSMAGVVIGKGGVNSKQICHMTGAKFAIRDHESDPNLKNIELEGTFDQIKFASQMVRELLGNSSGSHVPPMKNPPMSAGPGYGPASSTFKTKICENFTKGSCTFGEKCHFAHGQDELRRSGH